MKRKSRYQSIVIRPSTHVSFSGELKTPDRGVTSVAFWVLATLCLAVLAIAAPASPHTWASGPAPGHRGLPSTSSSTIG